MLELLQRVLWYIEEQNEYLKKLDALTDYRSTLFKQFHKDITEKIVSELDSLINLSWCFEDCDLDQSSESCSGNVEKDNDLNQDIYKLKSEDQIGLTLLHNVQLRNNIVKENLKIVCLQSNNEENNPEHQKLAARNVILHNQDGVNLQNTDFKKGNGGTNDYQFDLLQLGGEKSHHGVNFANPQTLQPIRDLSCDSETSRFGESQNCVKTHNVHFTVQTNKFPQDSNQRNNRSVTFVNKNHKPKRGRGRKTKTLASSTIESKNSSYNFALKYGKQNDHGTVQHSTATNQSICSSFTDGNNNYKHEKRRGRRGKAYKLSRINSNTSRPTRRSAMDENNSHKQTPTEKMTETVKNNGVLKWCSTTKFECKKEANEANTIHRFYTNKLNRTVNCFFCGDTVTTSSLEAHILTHANK